MRVSRGWVELPRAGERSEWPAGSPGCRGFRRACGDERVPQPSGGGSAPLGRGTGGGGLWGVPACGAAGRGRLAEASWTPLVKKDKVVGSSSGDVRSSPSAVSATPWCRSCGCTDSATYAAYNVLRTPTRH
ncbi:PREDICTED: glutaredoxin-related protein 5, mitochondrial [Rhinopithecus bieti]|uniref:glutaredoxin-related protein 5, mitochondrial n=1 Tax=Rhinopithecus bieti TaxID=61621 RepID=UPI00083BE666|nr:PREDICTED: glutaredoxin-related protein 5, mitochondrial [Rhinopithecus bieti]